MKKLIAKYPILHLSKLYKIGEELPANNPEMVKAWVENQSAEWNEDSKEVTKEDPKEPSEDNVNKTDEDPKEPSEDNVDKTDEDPKEPSEDKINKVEEDTKEPSKENLHTNRTRKNRGA